jgi:biotin carboxyl carrier protein
MTFEVPSPVTGRVIALHVAPGERVEGGIPLATFDEVVPERK